MLSEIREASPLSPTHTPEKLNFRLCFVLPNESSHKKFEQLFITIHLIYEKKGRKGIRAFEPKRFCIKFNFHRHLKAGANPVN